MTKEYIEESEKYGQFIEDIDPFIADSTKLSREFALSNGNKMLNGLNVAIFIEDKIKEFHLKMIFNLSLSIPSFLKRRRRRNQSARKIEARVTTLRLNRRPLGEELKHQA